VALQRIGAAGAALVDEDDVALPAYLAERGVDLRPYLDRRLARAAGEEEHRVGLLAALVGGRQPRDVQCDPAAAGIVGVLRHLEGGAARLHAADAGSAGQGAGLEHELAVLVAGNLGGL